MGYKLCMTEKPSVARDIARVIGATKRCDGYFEGNGYRVTWAVGHLVGLAEPDAYGYVPKEEMYKTEANRQTAYDELPLMPDEFQLVVIESTKDQFEVIKNLLHDPEVTEVINCGDMGPEGHILQWFIREKAGCAKPVRRFCATSMTDEAIRQAMANLRPEEEFADIIKGEFCKKKADWMLGMSLSRCASIRHHANITVGRVQSPTLYFVVKRYLEVKNFKTTDYYGLEAGLTEGFSVFWNKDTENVFPAKSKDDTGRLLNQALAMEKAEEVKVAGAGEVVSVETKKKGKERPQLYDITELERDANRKFGYTAAQTLATAQALYETQKVLSYPRTDSRYITSDLESYMPERIRMIGTVGGVYKEAADTLLSAGLKIDKRIVDDSKVTDHHALIPTEKIENFDLERMQPTPEEKQKGVTAQSLKNVLGLVLNRMMVAFSQIYIYEATSVAVRFGDITFAALGTRPLDMGWKGVEEQLAGKEVQEPDAEADAEQIFPDFAKGQIVHAYDCKVKAKKTTPPKLHTEATLLTAMENAGATIENGAILKGRGIGTQATRAAIIEKLFSYGYCVQEKKGKTAYIVPTETGLNIIRLLPEELYSPKLTGDWETKIAMIAERKMTEDEFLSDFKDFLTAEVIKLKESDLDISFKKKAQSYGKCPWCGGDILRYQKKGEKNVRFYCAEKGCHFCVDTDNPYVEAWTGKKLTEKQCQLLAEKGEITLSCKRKAGSGTYKGKFTVFTKEVDGRVYTNLRCEPMKTTRRKSL
ncbi:MAG: DNA topoisomerase [Clostridiales bacterium]|nr:DNA topoisomerase [Clostridiales bacterium]